MLALKKSKHNFYIIYIILIIMNNTWIIQYSSIEGQIQMTEYIFLWETGRNLYDSINVQNANRWLIYSHI